MKNLFTYEQYLNKLNEAEEPIEGDSPDNNGEGEETKSMEHLPRLSTVVEKGFFKELKEHMHYWFSYDKRLKNEYEIESLEDETRAVVMWVFDRVDGLGEVPDYAYKIKFSDVETLGDIEKVEEVLLIIKVYGFEDKKLLKETEMKITLENINAKFVKSKIDSLTKRILKAPTSEEDVEDFEDKEERRLQDGMY